MRLLKVLKAWYLDNLHKGAQKDLMVHWSFRTVYVMATAQREGHLQGMYSHLNVLRV